LLSATQANFDSTVPFGDADRGPSLGRPTWVGSYRPNAWGLYDMHGNITQWCSDGYADDYYRVSPGEDPKGPAATRQRVTRGGNWRSEGWRCRAAARGSNGQGVVGFGIGFRVACDVSPQP
jgi:formylglycine-generating enzyme required for sulfatase activity